MRKSVLFLTAFFGCLFVFTSCNDNAISADSLTTDHITQGTIHYDTLPMRGASGDTIDVVEAIRIGNSLSTGATSSQYYYILGSVSDFYQAYDATYGNISPYLTDRLQSRTLACYRLKSFKNTTFTSADQLAIGDVVVVYGQIQNFRGSAQLAQGCYLVKSDNPNSGYVPDPVVAFSESFNNDFGAFTFRSVLAASSDVWTHVAPTAEGADGYARAYAVIDNETQASEQWLVSPAIDLTQCISDTVVLSFSHRQKDAIEPAAELTIEVSTDGTNWTELTIPEQMWNVTATRWTTATIDISSFVSTTTQIAFRYTSTADNAARWDIKNVMVGDKGIQ